MKEIVRPRPTITIATLDDFIRTFMLSFRWRPTDGRETTRQKPLRKAQHDIQHGGNRSEPRRLNSSRSSSSDRNLLSHVDPHSKRCDDLPGGFEHREKKTIYLFFCPFLCAEGLMARVVAGRNQLGRPQATAPELAAHTRRRRSIDRPGNISRLPHILAGVRGALRAHSFRPGECAS